MADTSAAKPAAAAGEDAERLLGKAEGGGADREEEELKKVEQRHNSKILVAIAGAAWLVAAGVPFALAAIRGWVEGKDISRAEDLIVDAEKTASIFGMAPAPMYWITVKGYLNFFYTLATTLGLRALCGGRAALREGLLKDMHMKVQAFVFQAATLASTAFAYATLATTVQPWRSWEHWRVFTYLLSQHTATITLLTGLGNNFVVSQTNVRDSPESTIRERACARFLCVLGLATGGPLWLGIATTAMRATVTWMACAPLAFLQVLIVLSAVEAICLKQDFWSCIHDMWEVSTRSATFACTMLTALTLWFAFVWCNIPWGPRGDCTEYRQSLASTVPQCELLAPLVIYYQIIRCVLFGWTGVGGSQEAVYWSTFAGFTLGMFGVFAVMMTVPMSMLSYEPTIGFHCAAAEVYEAKVGVTFVNVTFVRPAWKLAAAVNESTSIDAAYMAQTAASQLVSFFT